MPNKRDSLVIFSYTLAGLGHLRVSNALKQAIPANMSHISFNSEDTSTTYLHRISSKNIYLRKLMEWSQKGFAEKIFTKLYILLLRHTSKSVSLKLVDLINGQRNKPENVLIVCTHFGLAHQIANKKDYISSLTDTKLFLIVVVTDDSPQYPWYVPNADLIVTPSQLTKDELFSYAKKNHDSTKFIMSPYPLSKLLTEKLSALQFKNRVNQLTPKVESDINVLIPISGAAVSTEFYLKLIKQLGKLSPRYKFYVPIKKADYTIDFIRNSRLAKNTKVFTSDVDKEVVEIYDGLYRDYIYSLEITKPSEQSFKALLQPNQRGGSILLFSVPIGRQETDNLNFLRRHKLIPSINEQNQLWSYARKKQTSLDINKELLEKAKTWRGLLLPMHTENSVEFINWCLEEKIFQIMAKSKNHISKDIMELSSNGATNFWKELNKLLLGKQRNFKRT